MTRRNRRKALAAIENAIEIAAFFVGVIGLAGLAIFAAYGMMLNY